MKRPKRVPRWRRKKKKVILYRPGRHRGRKRAVAPAVAVATTFFTPSDFTGDDNHQPARPKATGEGQATYVGQVVFTNVDRTLVQSLLPPGASLKLATNNANSGLHPIIHLQGRQTQTAWIIDGSPRPVGSDYAEFILLIPFVQIGTGTQWYNYVPRIYLTDIGACTLGTLFNYRKEMASILVFAQDFDVNAVDYLKLNTETAFQCHRTSVGGWLDDAAATVSLPNYTAMKAIVGMPILGVDPWTNGRLASYFRLDFTNAQIAPFDCNHEYFDRFTPDGLEGVALVSAQNGAFSVQNLEWRLSYPATPV